MSSHTKDGLIEIFTGTSPEKPMQPWEYEYFAFVMEHDVPGLAGDEELKQALVNLPLADIEDTTRTVKLYRNNHKPPKNHWWWWIDKLQK